MSNSDFEDRLSRIKAGGAQQAASISNSQRDNSSRVRRIIVAAVTVNAGALLIRFTNTGYDSIRDQYGILAALGLALASIALTVFGVVLFIRAIRPGWGAPKGQSALTYPTDETRAKEQPSIDGLAQGFRFGRLLRNSLLLVCGVYLIALTNNNYESIRDQYGLAVAAGLGLGGLTLALSGFALKIRAVFQLRNATDTQMSVSYPSSLPRPRVQTSAGARAFFSLFGLALGGLACFFMYMSNAGRQLGVIGQVDVKTANTMALGGVVIALVLVALALLIGFIGLFVRGLPMRRVPIFFLLGAMLLYTSFQTLRIHPSNWPTFMAEVTRQLNSLTVE